MIEAIGRCKENWPYLLYTFAILFEQVVLSQLVDIYQRVFIIAAAVDVIAKVCFFAIVVVVALVQNELLSIKR